MNTAIRLMTREDKFTVMEMMRVFYASPAVLSNGSDEIFENDIENCVNDSPYLEGFIFEDGKDIQGYGMIAKSFSTEFGRPCIWIEDLYIKPDYRGLGIGSMFFDYLKGMYTEHIFRLEVEEENERAIHVYEKNGFDVLPYMEMLLVKGI
ncbi:MAG: GNAT family N-acetyltransferase [Agathobacter sp.]|nr:GNAT family N-acetyltransferase [Agathobacter sp.]